MRKDGINSSTSSGSARIEAGVVFDLDGVVLDSEELHYRAYSAVMAKFGVTIDRALYGRVWIGEGRGRAWVDDNCELPISSEEVRRRKVLVYQRLLAEEAKLMPGGAEALARISAAMPIALATNSRTADVELVLDRFDLRKLFSAVITRENYEKPKPAPDAFLAAARALSLQPGRCLVVEDAAKGVRAAHAAGCQSVAVPHDFTRENDFTLAARVLWSLDELTAALVEEILK